MSNDVQQSCQEGQGPEFTSADITLVRDWLDSLGYKERPEELWPLAIAYVIFWVQSFINTLNAGDVLIRCSCIQRDGGMGLL